MVSYIFLMGLWYEHIWIFAPHHELDSFALSISHSASPASHPSWNFVPQVRRSELYSCETGTSVVNIPFYLSSFIYVRIMVFIRIIETHKIKWCFFCQYFTLSLVLRLPLCSLWMKNIIYTMLINAFFSHKNHTFKHFFLNILLIFSFAFYLLILLTNIVHLL